MATTIAITTTKVNIKWEHFFFQLTDLFQNQTYLYRDASILCFFFLKWKKIAHVLIINRFIYAT